MSVALAEFVLDGPTTRVRVDQPVAPTAPGRTRPRRSGPGVGPAARPRRLRFAPPPVPAARSRACRPAPPLAEPVRQVGASSWRLTDRGLAVVLVLAAALVAASVVVVGLTAFRVTGDSYREARAEPISVVAGP